MPEVRGSTISKNRPAMRESVKYPWAMGAPNGESRFTRSRSTWIHWWSPVASAKRTMSSYFMVRQSDLPRSLPASASRPAIPSITVLLAMGRSISRRAGRDDEALRGASERPLEVGELTLGEPGAVAVRLGDDLQAYPFAARLAAEVDGQVRVEERPPIGLERRAHSALGVGEDEDALARRGRLAPDERKQGTHPGIDRSLRPGAARDADLDRRMVGHLVPEEGEPVR